MIKDKGISIMVQKKILELTYPDSHTYWEKNGSCFVWISNLKPTELSTLYKVKMVCQYGKHPDVYIISPHNLPLANGKDKLPHIYTIGHQHICLYVRPWKEWSASKSIAKYIVPWISEWLLYYELWVSTGEWYGGGYHNHILT